MKINYQIISNRLLLPFMLLFYGVWVLIFHNNPFFWDTVLSVKIALFYEKSGIGNLIIPADLDAGHPPLFPLYILGCWKLFGKTLLVSHLAMLPFLLLMSWSFFSIAKKLLTDDKKVLVACLIFLAEPTLLAQSSLVSYDIVMLTLFLFGLRSILYNNRDWLYWINIILGLITVRAIPLIATLFLIDLYIAWKNEKFNWWKLLSPYIVGDIIILGWHCYHYSMTGWALFSQSATWEGQRELGTFQIIIKNIAVIGRNILDFGRVILWLLIVFFFAKTLLKKDKLSINRSVIYAILFLVLFVQIITLIPFTNPIGHRYLLPVYVWGIIVFADHIFKLKRPVLWLSLTFSALICGHFIVYPDTISKGWDSSLAYLPYSKLNLQMNHYISENNINRQDIGTRFPLRFSDMETNLEGDTIEYRETNQWMEKCPFILQSNISNDFEGFELNDLNKNWKLIHEVRTRKIYIRLYQNPIGNN